MSDRPGEGGADWAGYARTTAGREPLRFFDKAIDVTGGGDGRGRVVVDLGAGAGNETLAFLERGWRVHAVDGEPEAIEILLSRVPAEQADRLTTDVAYFHEMDIPPADLVFASLSLPFAAEHLDTAMGRALAAVKPGAWFVGVLFGHEDTWASGTSVKSLDVAAINAYLAGFDTVEIEEEEFDGPSSVGDKHWHWYVAAARRAGP